MITFWLVFGGLCLLLETIAIPGIGFLFAGLAGVTTGGLIQFGIINADNHTLQMAVFLACGFLWAAILWLPLQKFHKKNKVTGFNNMVNDVATICNGALEKGKIGQAKWSGTVMNAKIADNCPVAIIEDGNIVKITAVEGNILIINKE